MTVNGSTTERREFIRHAVDMPITFTLIDQDERRGECLKDVSFGGLCFNTITPPAVGSEIRITIPICTPEFEARGTVAWVSPKNGAFDVGVQFTDKRTASNVRMVEQVCHIDQFRMQIFQNQGRYLTAEEAATEWLAKHNWEIPW
jgi:Tfp pilus assembly protein PilZ